MHKNSLKLIVNIIAAIMIVWLSDRLIDSAAEAMFMAIGVYIGKLFAYILSILLVVSSIHKVIDASDLGEKAKID